MDNMNLDAFQKQLDKTRLAAIKHDNAYDDEMKETFKQLNKEVNELKIILDWYYNIGFLPKSEKELKDGPASSNICG